MTELEDTSRALPAPTGQTTSKPTRHELHENHASATTTSGPFRSDDAFRSERTARAEWDQLDALFEAVVDLDPDAQSRYLDDHCDDPAVRRQVERLIEGDQHAVDFLESPPARPVPSETEGPSEASTAGPYRLLETLGRGGMGTVYRAERLDGAFEHHVAVKVLDEGLLGALHRQRFESERQILAKLDHPNIARLLDGGTTSDGRPYIVMELIDGVPITDYCDDMELSIRERVALLRPVCDAVQYAHTNLVVHRDLKPANILVTQGGVPKLLDFGIAKLLDPDAFPLTVDATRTGLHVMTPRYASPEQLRGDTITTASDVYSLGVVLYRMLTGRLPYEVGSPSPLAIARVIEEREPTRPSTAVSEAKGTKTVDQRTTRARRRDLVGDLDQILLMALRKEPRQRYASAQAFEEDLARHLRSEPVVARRGNWTYHLGSFVRRHKLGVAAATLVLVAALGAAAAFRAQATRVAVERDRAERVIDLFVGFFETVDPRESRGETLTAREVLDAGSREVLQQLDDRPLVRATLVTVLAKVYIALGLYEDADRLLTALDDKSKAEAPTRFALGMLRARQGQEQEAIDAFEALMADPRQDERTKAPSMLELAALHLQRGRYPQAESMASSSLAILEAGAPDDPLLAEALLRLASVRSAQGDLESATELASRGVALQEHQYGIDALETAEAYSRLAEVLTDHGEHGAAAERFAQAAQIQAALLGVDHPDTARSRSHWANNRSAMGYLDEADEALERALTIQRAFLGRSHPDIAYTLTSQSDVAYQYGNLEDGLRLALEAQDILRPFAYPRHQRQRLAIKNSIAVFYTSLGRPHEAIPLLESVIEIASSALPETNPSLLLWQTTLAAILMRAGPLPKAREHLHHIERILHSLDHSPFQQAQLTLIKRYLAILYRFMGDDQTIDYATSLVTRSTHLFGADNANTIWDQVILADGLRAFGHLEKAESLLRAALQAMNNHPDVSQIRKGQAQFLLADILRRTQRLSEAETLVSPAADATERLLAVSPSRTRARIAANVLRLLGQIVWYRDPAEARRLWTRALTYLEGYEEPEVRTLNFGWTLVKLLLLLGRLDEAKPVLDWLHEQGVFETETEELARQAGIFPTP